MEFSRIKNLFVVLIITEILLSGFSFTLSSDKVFFAIATQAAVASMQENAQSNVSQIDLAPLPAPLPPPPPQKLSNPPETIKAIYVTGWSAGSKKYLNYLTELFKESQINAVVIDIKDYSGLVSYASGASEVKKYNLFNNAIADINELVRFLHSKNIYVIGRISVFEDPAYSKARTDLAIYNKASTTDTANPVLWKDNNGLSWLDPASKDVWDYNISLAKDVLSHGFDEINFDYIRFPSDGNTDNMGFPVWDKTSSKRLVIKSFFKYLSEQLAQEKISVDLFGQTTTSADDMGIGQKIEDAFDYFDYLCPMVYPSHYISGYMGFANPAQQPYEVVKHSMETALSRQKLYLKSEELKYSEATGSPAADAQVPNIADIKLSSKFRPWLQDFNMGADYTALMVKQEISATKEALGQDYNGFMLWNPSNVYTFDAIKLETPLETLMGQ